jgi:spermidine/putrescine transport system substrate-binding protein
VRTMKWMTAALAAGATMLLAAGLAQAADKLVISNWANYMPPDLPEKFKAETGIEVEVAVHATNEEIMGKVVASKGEGFDVLFVSSPFAEALSKLGIIAKLDRSKLSNIANLYPKRLSSSMTRAIASRSPILGGRQACATARMW